MKVSREGMVRSATLDEFAELVTLEERSKRVRLSLPDQDERPRP